MYRWIDACGKIDQTEENLSCEKHKFASDNVQIGCGVKICFTNLIGDWFGIG